MFWGIWNAFAKINLLFRNSSLVEMREKAYLSVDLVMIFERQESHAISIHHINQAIFCINTP